VQYLQAFCFIYCHRFNTASCFFGCSFKRKNSSQNHFVCFQFVLVAFCPKILSLFAFFNVSVLNFYFHDNACIKKKTLRLQMISGGRGERHVFSYSFIALLSRSFNWKPSLFIVCYTHYVLHIWARFFLWNMLRLSGQGCKLFFVKISSQNHSKIERQRWRHKKVRISVHGGLNFHRVGAVTKHIL